MPSMMPWPCLAVLGLGLAACAGEMAAQPEMLAEVKRYYDQHAMEEGGLCGSTRLDRVNGSSIEDQSAERLTLRVSYAYSDPSMKSPGYTDSTLWSGGKSNIAGPSRCQGFGTRSFTIARRTDGYEVLGMTGPQRKGIKINRIERNVW